MSTAPLTIIPWLAPGSLLRRPAEVPLYPLGEPGRVLFDSAARALLAGLGALGLRAGDGVLVPALHRGAEVDVLRAAGLAPTFYAGTATLEPDAGELGVLLGDRVRALYLIHQLGFAQDAARWRAWCDERGLLLLEDATRAWTARSGGRAVGRSGHLAVFSLTLSFGLPGGGVLLADPSPAEPGTQERSAVPGLARCGSRRLAQRLAAFGGLTVPNRVLGVPSERWSASADARGPSPATLRLLPRVADAHAAACRRAHYAVLLEALGELVLEPFRDGTDAAPFGVPIADAGGVRDRLRAGRIEAPRAWAAPRTPHRLASTLLLPVHQELRPADVERIAATVHGTRPAPRGQLRSEAIEAVDAPHPEWDELALRTGSVFATRDWLATWWRHFAGDRELELRACRAPDGRLVAILPLCVQRRAGLRIVRFLGHGTSDECGPICAPADRPATARALRRQLHHLRADVLLGEQLAGDEGWDALLGARVLRRTGSPVLAFGQRDWKQTLAGFGSSLRTRIGGLSRKLEREHGMSYRATAAPAELPDDFASLLRLHSARWEGATTFVDQADFHLEFAAVALERGWLRLLVLELAGEPVAVLHSMRYAGTETHYQSGREPAWNKRSVGTLIVVESIRLAHEAGMREFRFGRGDESYKYRYATSDPGVHTIGLAGSAPGAVALAATAAVPRGLAKRVRKLTPR
jgi:CelD/BcsL family acetyltransferase involved in cellulose biosynthesis